MLCSELISELANRLKLSETERDTNRALLLQKINHAYQEVARAYDWEHLKRTGEVRTIPNYTTGTCSIINGSNIVSGNGVWTSDMEGSYFKPQGSGNWYRISKVQSASQLILLTPIIDATASAQTYAIWKRFYYLYSEVHRILGFGSWIRNGELVDKPSQYAEDVSTDISVSGEPETFSAYGADPFERSYSTGTITTSKDSNLLVGLSTAWLGNIEPGDIISIGGTVKSRVKRVESDTAIRMTNFVDSDVSGSTYSIAKDSPLGIQLYFAANTAYLFPYTYSKRVYDMLHDGDRPELPSDFDQAILDGAFANRMRDLNDQRWVNSLNEYTARVKDLIGQRFVSKPRSRTMPIKITTRGGYI